MARLIAMMLLLVPAAAFAQPSATVSMQASQTRVAVGDTIELHVEAEVQGGRIEAFEVPKLDAFEVVAHSKSTPFQFSVSFGQKARIQSSQVHSFRLRAIRQGQIVLEPAVVVVDGKTFKSQPLTITVDEGSANPSSQAIDPTTSAPDDRAFVRVVTQPANPYVGQQVTVQGFLYSASRLSRRGAHATKPDMADFWVHDLGQPATERIEDIGGRRFVVYPLFSIAAFPLKSGELTIGHAEVTFDVSDGWLDSERITRQSDTTSMTVKPLPTPVPDNVVVGQVEVTSTLDRPQVVTGEAVTLNVEVNGTGDPQNLVATLPPIDGLRILGPANKDRIETPGGVVRTHRNAEWIIVPQQPGQFTIPAVSFEVFDPNTQSYATVSTNPFVLEATGQVLDGAPIDKEASPPSIALPELGPIRAKSELRTTVSPTHKAPWYVFALLAPPLLLLFGLGATFARRTTARSAQHSFANATNPALTRAAQFAKEGQPRRFYDETAQALLNALSFKLDQPAQGMTHPELKTELAQLGADDDLIERIINELESCDFARYSSVAAGSSEMSQALSRVRTLVQRVAQLPEAQS